ncbi:MAG TPA: Lrp/AsnC family transcriptional regulator, partial [Stellaceae bacterium]|nr:Lrp/AsnC family transcriptional regulator [Stellaceae bacterium]
MKEEFSIDEFDRKILAALQEDAGLSNAEIAERVGLSLTPCWRRIRNLEEAGVIRRRVALLDRRKLNVGVTVFVSVRTNQHNQEWLERFARAVDGIPEVVEF